MIANCLFVSGKQPHDFLIINEMAWTLPIAGCEKVPDKINYLSSFLVLLKKLTFLKFISNLPIKTIITERKILILNLKI